MDIKQKVRIKPRQMNKDIFSNQTLVSINCVLIYSNELKNAKRFNSRKYYLPKDIIKNYNAIIDGKNFYNQPIE